MKITNKDICKRLEEETKKEWCFDFGYYGPTVIPCFYVKGYKGSLKDSKKMITIQPNYKGFNNDEVKDYFNNIDWAQEYFGASNILYKSMFSSYYKKLVEKKDKTTKSSMVFIIPQKLKTIISNIINKTYEKKNEK